MRTLTLVARAVGLTSWALLLVGLGLWVLGNMAGTLISGQQAGRGGLAIAVMYTLIWMETAAVGLLIAARQPRNLVGWLTLAASLFSGFQAAANGYAEYAALHPGLPGLELSAWIGSWIGALAIGLVVIALVMFPSGRLPVRSAWWIVVVAAASSLAQTIALALGPGPLRAYPTLDNPFAFGLASRTAVAVGAAATVGLALSMLGSAGLLAFRLARATGRERQQLKWIAYAAVLFAVGVALLSFAPAEAIGVAAVIFALTGAGLTTAVGIAILRHQLFDIDVLINHTLVYGSLVITLGLAYAVAVVVLQRLLAPLTGGSELAIAGSTLGVAALFGPALRRIRDAIDRRFYRSKYDAARTLELFGERVRQEVDLEALTNDLLTLVEDTLQPGHVALWVRPAPSTLPSRHAAEAPEGRKPPGASTSR